MPTCDARCRVVPHGPLQVLAAEGPRIAARKAVPREERVRKCCALGKLPRSLSTRRGSFRDPRSNGRSQPDPGIDYTGNVSGEDWLLPLTAGPWTGSYRPMPARRASPKLSHAGTGVVRVWGLRTSRSWPPGPGHEPPLATGCFLEFRRTSRRQQSHKGQRMRFTATCWPTCSLPVGHKA